MCTWGDGLLNVIILGGLRVRSRWETKVALSVRRKIFAISGGTFVRERLTPFLRVSMEICKYVKDFLLKIFP